MKMYLMSDELDIRIIIIMFVAGNPYTYIFQMVCHCAGIVRHLCSFVDSKSTV